MKTKVLILSLCVCLFNSSMAQNAIAKLKYEQAEQAFKNEEISDAEFDKSH